MEGKTKDLGVIHGTILVFGGVYSNFQALTELKNIISLSGIRPSNIINTGDVVGYCAQPEESVQEIKSWGIHSIAGNVEMQLREREENCGCSFTPGSRCDGFSKTWYPFAQAQVSEDALQWMDELPDFLKFKFGKYNVLVLHGSYHRTSEFIFESTDAERKLYNFEDAGADVIIAGHCGLPFTQKIGDKIWINAGVIGMPANDGTPRVWYARLELDDSGNLRTEHRDFTYDHKLANQKMIAHHLPEEYAKTILTGIWDNCEILPEPETQKQGIKLVFN